MTTKKEVALDVFIKMNTSGIALSIFDIIVAQVEGGLGESLHDLVANMRAWCPMISEYYAPEDLVLYASALLQGRAPTNATYMAKDFGSRLLDKAELEAAFRKLPIAPPNDGRIPYELLIPGIGRQLALMKPVDRKVASPDATKRKLVALKKHAKILCEDMSAMALLPLKLRILIVEIAQENPKLPPRAGRGAPQKSLAMQVAPSVAEHFYGLTGTRPTRITPPGGGKANGPFL